MFLIILVRTTFTFLCLGCFLSQFYQFSSSYFRYETSGKTEIYCNKNNNNDDTMIVMFCSDLTGLVNRTNADKYGIMPELEGDMEDHFNDIGKLSLSDIFDLTPDVTSVIKSCQVSIPVIEEESYRFGNLSSQECLKYFRVIRAVNGIRMCYGFNPRKRTSTSSSLRVGQQNIVYEIQLDDPLARFSRVIIIAYTVSAEEKNMFPYVDKRFGAVTDQSENDYYSVPEAGMNKDRFNIRYSIYPTTLSSVVLEKPYDTQCVARHKPEVCYHDCLMISYQKKIHKIPWVAFADKRSEKYHIITNKDFSNESLVRLQEFLSHECYDRCIRGKIQCQVYVTQTRIEQTMAYPAGGYNNALILTVMSLNAPHIDMVSFPSMKLSDYFFISSALVTFWLGISALNLNPKYWPEYAHKSLPRCIVFGR